MSKRGPPAPDSLASDKGAGGHIRPAHDDSTTDVGVIPTASVEAIADTLIEESPEPQPHAIAQAAADRAQSAEDSKDADGTPFDPSLHSGTKTTAGIWRKRSGRKAAGAKTKLNIPNSQPASGAAQGDVSKQASSRATGKMAANLFLMLSCGLGGAEWMPRKEPMDEKAMLEEGFADYFESKQWEDMPPGIALVACLGMYALPRFAMPKTQERAKGFKTWLVGKYIGWKAKRARKAYEKRFGPTAVERADDASRAAYARETEAKREAEIKLHAV